MGWSYTDPGASDKDAVRFEIQDTDPSAALLQDGEITYALTVEAGTDTPRSQQGIFAAAARCCEALSRRFAMQADTVVGSLQTDYSAMAKNYADRAQELRVKASSAHMPYAGGLSLAEKEAAREDPDRVQPFFGRDQFRTPYRSGGDGGFPPRGDC